MHNCASICEPAQAIASHSKFTCIHNAKLASRLSRVIKGFVIWRSSHSICGNVFRRIFRFFVFFNFRKLLRAARRPWKIKQTASGPLISQVLFDVRQTRKMSFDWWTNRICVADFSMPSFSPSNADVSVDRVRDQVYQVMLTEFSTQKSKEISEQLLCAACGATCIENDFSLFLFVRVERISRSVSARIHAHTLRVATHKSRK